MYALVAPQSVQLSAGGIVAIQVRLFAILNNN